MKDYQSFHITCKGLIFHRNRFLLHRASDPEFLGSLECPGGRVDRGELLGNVLRRELQEEIGVDINMINGCVLELFDINQRDEIEYGWDDRTQIVEIYYKIIIPDDFDLKLKKLEEVSAFEWVDKYTNLDNFSYRVVSRKNVYKKAQRLLFNEI